MHSEDLRRFLIYCFLCLLTLSLTGCITTLPIDKLPTTQETFRKPPVQLYSEYPVITDYDSTFNGFSKLKVTTLDAKQLISAWGEPDKKSTEWSYAGYMGATLIGCGFLFGPLPALITTGTVVLIRPYPFENYYWRKDDYCIEAKFDHALMHAYTESLIYWKWHHKSDGKDVPIECGEQVEKGQLSTQNFINDRLWNNEQ